MYFKSSAKAVLAGLAALGIGACGGQPNSQAKAVTPVTAAATPPPTAPRYAAPAAAPAPASPSAASVQAESEPPAPAPQTWGNGEARSAEPAPGSPGNVGVTNPMGGVDVSSLDDAQLLAVVHAMNQGEIEEAQLARTKASAAAVKRFAEHMATVHRDMMNRDSALLARLQIIPTDNTVSDRLKGETRSEITALQARRGKDFDRDYVDAQVRNHNKALELLDRITPNVKNSELRAELASDRPRIEAHLRDAERLEQSMQRGSANTMPPQWHEPQLPGGYQIGPNSL